MSTRRARAAAHQKQVGRGMMLMLLTGRPQRWLRRAMMLRRQEAGGSREGMLTGQGRAGIRGRGGPAPLPSAQKLNEYTL